MAEQQKPEDKDQYSWAAWAVLVALVLFGLLGFFGVLSPHPKGPTAADVSPGIAEPAGSAGAR